MAILGADSYLMVLPGNLPPRTRVWLEAVAFAVAIADLTFERLRDLLLKMADEGGLLGSVLTIPSAYADAWGFVDSAHRLGDMITAGAGELGSPNLGRLGREYHNFSRALFKLRDAVQHVGHSELAGAEKSGIPVWGSLSWAVLISEDLVRMCALCGGGGGPTVNHQLVNPCGHTFHGRIDHIHLEAFGHRASISDAHRALAAYAGELERALSGKFSGQPRDAPSVLITVDCTFGRDDPATR